METIILLLTVLQSFAISLGVGSSTLAIVNFFVAISDGKIDDTERKMMGIVYIVLRIAMVLILLTTLALAISAYMSAGIAPETVMQLIIVGILFLNAILMTARLMPSTFGPALQAGSWYTLGTISALASVNAVAFSLLIFLLAYATWLVLAIAIVNGIMAWLRHKNQPRVN